MILKCIRQGGYHLTPGKNYQAEVCLDASGNEYYVVVSDTGEKIGWLDSTHFKLLSEVREEKLNEIGI